MNSHSTIFILAYLCLTDIGGINYQIQTKQQYVVSIIDTISIFKFPLLFLLKQIKELTLLSSVVADSTSQAIRI